jgi:hypothetical protein
MPAQQQPAGLCRQPVWCRNSTRQQARPCVCVLTYSVSETDRCRHAETSHSSFTGANSISLKKIVDMFYDKVLADTALAPFFENINMQKLKMHQVRRPRCLLTGCAERRAVC